jgi:hypothetical protein
MAHSFSAAASSVQLSELTQAAFQPACIASHVVRLQHIVRAAASHGGNFRLVRASPIGRIDSREQAKCIQRRKGLLVARSPQIVILAASIGPAGG